MKVFNLACAHDHAFEGWFASHAAFETQREEGLISCPYCDNQQIEKRLSAPHIGMRRGGSAEPGELAERNGAERSENQTEVSAPPAQMWQMMRELLAKTEDVGHRFPEEARRMHYGEAPDRSIRGVASREEREELREEGIQTFSMPLPAGLNEPIQ
jgi:hypothetical protein